MTDAITLLTSDHRSVQSLFTQVEGVAAPNPEVVHSLVKELSVHDAIEREYLYPAVREKVSSGSGMADHSIEEHDEVAETLLAIDKADDGSTEQASLLVKLIPAVQAHVVEEEGQIFPALRQALSEKELQELGDKLAKAKDIAPTRPHPHAPSEGLGTKLAGAASAPLDRARDAMSNRD